MATVSSGAVTRDGCREADLLRLCARTRLDPDTRGQVVAQLDAPIDWEFLFRLARQHKVVPLAFRSLSAACPEAVPPGVLGQLAAEARAIVTRNCDLTTELLAVLRLLEAPGRAGGGRTMQGLPGRESEGSPSATPGWFLTTVRARGQLPVSGV
jgi:Uncharacterised nucleotidyltransferase